MSFKIKFHNYYENNINNTKNSITVGISTDYPPFSFTHNGKFIGFDIDFAYNLGKILNKHIIFKDIDFSSLIPSLYSKKVDIVISSISKNYERIKNIDYSAPYYTSTLALITNKYTKIQTINDLQNIKIGVQTGTTMENFMVQYNKSIKKQIDLVSLNSNFLLLAKLKIGEIDGIVIENAQAVNFINNLLNCKAYLLENNFLVHEDNTCYVIGLRKKSQLVVKINRAIKNLNKNGKTQYLLNKWNISHR